MPRTPFRPSAWREVHEATWYLEEQSNADVAERFLSNLMTSCDALARMPLMAPTCGFKRPDLKNVRRWPVKGFENWLIFFLPIVDSIEVLHVIHGARDIESMFG